MAQTLQPDSSNAHAVQFLTTVTIRATTQAVSPQANLSAAHSAGAVDQVVYGFKANDFAFAKGGAVPLTKTTGAVPTGALAVLRIGLTGVAGLNGVVEQVKWGTAKPGNAAIQAKSGWTPAA